MPFQLFLAYIPLTFAIIILVYISAFETSMPYSVQLLSAFACFLLIILSMLILFGVVL